MIKESKNFIKNILIHLIFFELFKKIICFNCNSSRKLSNNPAFLINDVIFICVHFNLFNLKTSFSSNIDKNQILTLQGSFDIFNIKDTDLIIQTEQSSIYSNKIVKLKAFYS